MDFEARRIFGLFTIISYKSHPNQFCPLSKHVNVSSVKDLIWLSREQEKLKCPWCTEVSLVFVFFVQSLSTVLLFSFDLLLEFPMPFFELGTPELGKMFLILASTVQLQQRQCDLPTNTWIIFIHPDLIISDFTSAPFREIKLRHNHNDP